MRRFSALTLLGLLLAALIALANWPAAHVDAAPFEPDKWATHTVKAATVYAFLSRTPDYGSTATPAPTSTRVGQATATRTLVATATRAVTQTPTLLRTPTFTSTPTTTRTPIATPTLVRRGIVVDHNSVALFERIPEQYLTAARNLRMVFADQSVGQNIHEGLNCLSAASWGEAPAYCRRDYTTISGSTWNWATFSATDLAAGRVPARIQFAPDPTRYNRSNWSYLTMSGEWYQYLESFLTTVVPANASSKDVLSFQFSYLHTTNGSTIADSREGFFADQPRDGFYTNRVRWDISDLRAVEAQYPNRTFIYWTTSLSRGAGNSISTSFNDQMRAYAAANGRVLFDVADILSHDENGNACYDNRDAVTYCSANGCESYPDDGVRYPAICVAYTTEVDGGHLGSVSAGRLRVAKAFWVLMAQIAGWRP
jgi:hypothetical protein